MNRRTSIQGLLAALLLTAAAVPAGAASIRIDFRDGYQNINKAKCDKGGDVPIEFTLEDGAEGSWRLTAYLIKTGECTRTPADNLERIVLIDNKEYSAGAVVEPDVPISVQTNVGTFPDNSVCPEGQERTVKVCAYGTATVDDCADAGADCVFDAGAGTQILRLESAVIRYDAKPPAQPVITDVISRDAELEVKWSAPSDGDLSGYQMAVTKVRQVDANLGPCSGGELPTPLPPINLPENSREFGAEDTEGVIEDLENGFEYELKLVAIDEAGNESVPSAPMTGVPRLTQSFFTRLRCDGIDEEGGFGCSTASLALMPLGGVLLIPLFWVRGKRRKHE